MKDFFLIILINVLISNDKSLVRSEWIEIPEFSNDFKVYRSPNFKVKVDEVIQPNVHFNTKNSSKEKKHSEELISKLISLRNASFSGVKNNPPKSDQVFKTSSENNLTKLIKVGEKISVDSDQIENPLSSQILDEDAGDGKSSQLSTGQAAEAEVDENRKKPEVSVQDPSKPPSISPFTERNEQSHVNDPPRNSSLFSIPNESNFFTSMNSKASKMGYLLENLPINFLKNVHQVLQNGRKKTVKEKEEFFVGFKMNLMKEIKRRLVGLINPSRVKRGSGWNDDHVGFPSLEGALLAISFLTFAVYLVQLVMMLMRNLSTMPIPTTATVVVNRSKRARRSAIQPSNETVTILEYLDEFP